MSVPLARIKAKMKKAITFGLSDMLRYAAKRTLVNYFVFWYDDILLIWRPGLSTKFEFVEIRTYQNLNLLVFEYVEI